ncbi:DUF3560 domain-containing protein [Nocardia sp. 004]|uniref:DUF3560 domain-containing protein n=1 Tax=Nocardia sp. 004 TaxID=3385978 RepID=UPI0039A02687
MSENLTLSHTHAEGTILEGTTPGAGYGVLLAQATKGRRPWRFSGRDNRWFIRGTRDLEAPRDLIDRTAEVLRAAGHTVTVRIDDTPRPTAEVEADRRERAERRTAALERKAERRRITADEADAEEADAEEDHARESLPPFGQPILSGHHSEGKHRRLIAAFSQAADNAVIAHRETATAEARAKVAALATPVRENIAVTLRRIEELTAERGRIERQLNGHTRKLFTNSQTGEPVYENTPAAVGERREALTQDLAQVDDQLSYWRAHVAAAEAAGTVVFGPEKVRAGDYVRIRGQWWPHPVERVNRKTVRLGGTVGTSSTVPYDRITAVRDSAGRDVAYIDGVRVEPDVVDGER